MHTSKNFIYNLYLIVVSAGAFTGENFDPDTNAERLEVEYWVFKLDGPANFGTHFKVSSGMPGGFVEFADDGNEFYGMADGPNFDQYKIGDWTRRALFTLLEYFRNRVPDKLGKYDIFIISIDNIKYVHPCFFTIVKSGDFLYKPGKDGVHYAYGFSGTGFKFFPLHGKIVYDSMIAKTSQQYVPLNFRAKI